MDRQKAIVFAIIALVTLFVLFEVNINIEFSMPADQRVLEGEQEMRYAGCYSGRDQDIHAAAFSTIDNPDVQKLYISSHRAEAAEECRREFPEQWVTIAEPMRFNLIDLRFRFQ